MNQIIDDELERINKCRFSGFVKVAENILLPVFITEDGHKLIVSPREFLGECERFVINNPQEYQYFIKHQE